jgi:hypothetical protein
VNVAEILLAGHTHARTATAASQPCQLYAHRDSPRPSRTQHHHRYPEYLQVRLWGEVRLQTGEDMLWVCGLCHDSIHDAVGWLLGETRRPNPLPSRKAMTEARRAVSWYWALTR